MWKLIHFLESHGIGKYIRTVMSVMVNAIIKSKILVQAFSGSTLAVNNPPDIKVAGESLI